MAGWLTKAVSALGYWTQGPAKETDPILGEWLGGERSFAGRSVTTDSAMRVGTAWACMRLISQTWGTLPVEVRVWDDRLRGMVTAREHPLWALLHEQPNADMSAPEFWSAMGIGLLSAGNAYAEVHRTSPGLGGRVVALTILPPERVTVRRDESGALAYRYAEPGAPGRDLNEADVLHIKGVTRDGILGLSPIAQARETLGVAMAAEEAQARLFANGLRTNAYVSAPQGLTDKQRTLAHAMLAGFRGASNAGKLPVLENGWRIESLSLNPADAELLATREFTIEQICAWFGVPPFMVGHTQKSTSWGTGLESQLQAFHTLTMRPILKMAEGAIRRRLLTPAERSRTEVEFNVEGLLRADSSARAAFLKSMVEAGVITRNEARMREGLPPKPGGDDLTVQSNQLPLGRLGEATTRADLATPAAQPAENAQND